MIEGIIEQSGTPYFCFKDLDENKPTGSIRIRVETIDYFLRRYREEVIRKRKAVEDVDVSIGRVGSGTARLNYSRANSAGTGVAGDGGRLICRVRVVKESIRSGQRTSTAQ